jgi:hypothetical protein
MSIYSLSIVYSFFRIIEYFLALIKSPHFEQLASLPPSIFNHQSSSDIINCKYYSSTRLLHINTTTATWERKWALSVFPYYVHVKEIRERRIKWILMNYGTVILVNSQSSVSTSTSTLYFQSHSFHMDVPSFGIFLNLLCIGAPSLSARRMGAYAI